MAAASAKRSIGCWETPFFFFSLHFKEEDFIKPLNVAGVRLKSYLKRDDIGTCVFPIVYTLCSLGVSLSLPPAVVFVLFLFDNPEAILRQLKARPRSARENHHMLASTSPAASLLYRCASEKCFLGS